ncbi:hypothetical protein FN846DRAFT_906833 [Sphaerosporella brunnea]|uniref:Uncharacterized protein n=1 Tax=Sphaerosporella brunnea TaxID=1250544 RepID=A0A5J5EXW1_9PEZI|nr:hypothetical protein FN846DRAFT_906833 [Sphaerosporella brunnea]
MAHESSDGQTPVFDLAGAEPEELGRQKRQRKDKLPEFDLTTDSDDGSSTPIVESPLPGTPAEQETESPLPGTPAEQDTESPPATWHSFASAVTGQTGNTFTDGEPSETALDVEKLARTTTRTITRRSYASRQPFYIPRFNSVLSVRPHYFLVDENFKIIPPDHQRALTKLSMIPGVQPERKPAKAVYRLNIAFTPKDSNRGTRGMCIQGTAIHLGNSVFITCAHTLKWPSPVEGDNVQRWSTPNPRDYTSKITLASGSGNLTSKLNKVLTHTLNAKILAFARPVSELLSDTQKTSLLPYNFDVPVDLDAALLTATESLWKRKLITRPNLLPAHPPTTSSVPTFVVTVIAVNAADFKDSVYDTSQNTEQEVAAAVNRLLPDEISFAAKNGAACFSPVPGILDHTTVAPESGWLIKHKVAGVCGSSGGALLDCNNNLVGIEVGSEEVDGKVTPNCCNYGITWRGRLAEFAMDYIIPNLNTKGSRETRAAWEELLGLASKDE